MNHNIEIKAACDDLDQVRAAAQKLSARRASIEEQRDTYFRTSRGRLKLRRRLLSLALLDACVDASDPTGCHGQLACPWPLAGKPPVAPPRVATPRFRSHGAQEGDGAGDEHFELIWYQRPDTTTAKGSDYYLIRVIDGAELRQLLANGLGILAEVHKRRTVYLWRNVRIHLDEVERLGSFVELEAIVDESYDETSARAKIDHLCEALDIQPDQLVDVSYSDLLLSAGSSSTRDSNWARSS